MRPERPGKYVWLKSIGPRLPRPISMLEKAPHFDPPVGAQKAKTAILENTELPGRFGDLTVIPSDKLREVRRTRGSGYWEFSYLLSNIFFAQKWDQKSRSNDCSMSNRWAQCTLRQFCNWPKTRRRTHFGARPKPKFAADFCQVSWSYTNPKRNEGASEYALA